MLTRLRSLFAVSDRTHGQSDTSIALAGSGAASESAWAFLQKSGPALASEIDNPHSAAVKETATDLAGAHATPATTINQNRGPSVTSTEVIEEQGGATTGEMLTEAMHLARSGAPDLAQEILARATSLSMEDAEAHHRVGVVYRLCGKAELAAFHLGKALTINPNFHYSAIELGGIDYDRSAFDESRAWFRRAIEIKPGYHIAYLHAARVEVKVNDLQRAQGILLEGLRACVEVEEIAADLSRLEARLEPAVRVAHADEDALAYLAEAAEQRRGGHHHQARAILRKATIMCRPSAAVARELSELEIYHEDRIAAAAVLESAFASGLSTGELHVRYLTLLSELGRAIDVIAHREELGDVLQGHHRHVADMLCGHARLCQQFHSGALLEGAAFRSGSARWRSAATLLTELCNAVKAQRPYALIRLGDGEGRFMIYADKDAGGMMLPAERVATGQTIWWNWFGSDLHSVADVEMQNLAQAFAASLETADVIGTTDPDRLRRDRYHRGYLAHVDYYVTGLLNRHPSMAAAPSMVQTDLHRADPFFRDLLAEQEWLGFIGPHPDLLARLCRHLGIPAHTTILVPGEMRLPERDGLHRGNGHFPERYQEILADLSLPRPGAVVLVAAGLLGKIYCARIKALGGIAIDIGSLADAWTGHRTRPGQYEPPEAWQLPPLPAEPARGAEAA